MRQLIDQDDVEQVITYMCTKFTKCIQCNRTPRISTISLEAAREQEMISRSVIINILKKRVHVICPFIHDPIQELTSVTISLPCRFTPVN